MKSTVAAPRKIPITWIVLSTLFAVALIGGLAYLNRGASRTAPQTVVSDEAKAYLSNLSLEDVAMKATENFMQQQVVEIEGKIANKGPRPVQAIDVTCIFYGIDSKEVYRERVPIVRAKGAPLNSGETRTFRLPFDTLPDGWNQALPKLVIAQLKFAR